MCEANSATDSLTCWNETWHESNDHVGHGNVLASLLI